MTNLLKFEKYLGFKWSYNTLLFVLEASGTSVACNEAPNFVVFTLFSMELELVECTLTSRLISEHVNTRDVQHVLGRVRLMT